MKQSMDLRLSPGAQWHRLCAHCRGPPAWVSHGCIIMMSSHTIHADKMPTTGNCLVIAPDRAASNVVNQPF